jgi:hypothetical protein
MNPLVVQGAAQLLLGKYKSEKGMFMKNIITMAATGLVIFAGLGWYLDWYKVDRTTTPDGKQHIVIDVNTKRIESDFEKGRNQVNGYFNNSALGGTPSPTPPVAYPNQPNQQPYQIPSQSVPNQGWYPQQPAPSAPTYQQPLPQQPWVPAQAVNRANGGGYVFPGQQGATAPQNIPGRP